MTFYIPNSYLKKLNDEIQDLTNILLSDSIKSMEHYKKTIGMIQGLQKAELLLQQSIKELSEVNDDE